MCQKFGTFVSSPAGSLDGRCPEVGGSTPGDPEPCRPQPRPWRSEGRGRLSYGRLQARTPLGDVCLGLTEDHRVLRPDGLHRNNGERCFA